MRLTAFNINYKKYIVFAAGLVLLFGVIAVAVTLGLTGGFDDVVYAAAKSLHGNFLTGVFKLVSDMGDTVFIMPLCVALLILTKTRFNYGIYAAFTMIISPLLNTMLKGLFMRERPDILRLVAETSFSFPSGHAMNNMALYMLLSLVIVKMCGNKKLRIAAVAVFMAHTLTVGFSRIYLGVHYASDVAAGFMIGAAWAVLSFCIVNYTCSLMKALINKKI